MNPDPLSTVLQDLRLSAAHYCQCEVRAPWGLRLPERSEAMVHVVLEGDCWLEVAAQPPRHLRAGDIVMLPHGNGHRLLSAPGLPGKPVEAFSTLQLNDTSFRLTAGGTGRKARFVCCGVDFEEPTIHPLLALMPRVLLVRDEGTKRPVLQLLLDAMTAEIREQRLGAATVMTRLADIIVTQLVRAWVEERPDRAHAWAAAIRDPQVGRALAAFHAAPGRAWSVALLAAASNLSRSAFADRFTSAVGMSPAQYVARGRIHVASVWLRGNQLTIDQISTRLGFGSEASFSRTFKRLVGSSPAVFRRASRRNSPESAQSTQARQARKGSSGRAASPIRRRGNR